MSWPTSPRYAAHLAAITPGYFAASAFADAFDPRAEHYGAVWYGNNLYPQGWWDAVQGGLVPFSREGMANYVGWLDVWSDPVDFPFPVPSDVAEFFGMLPNLNKIYQVMDAQVQGGVYNLENILPLLSYIRQVGYLQDVGYDGTFVPFALGSQYGAVLRTMSVADGNLWLVTTLASAADRFAVGLGLAPPFGGVTTADVSAAYYKAMKVTDDQGQPINYAPFLPVIPPASEYLAPTDESDPSPAGYATPPDTVAIDQGVLPFRVVVNTVTPTVATDAPTILGLPAKTVALVGLALVALLALDEHR